MLYWAYGSNLSVRRMRMRCPDARPVGPLVIADGALTFRGVADVTIRKGSLVAGGLWRITRACERSLDAAEGVSNRWYLKRYLQLSVKGKIEDCLFYQMRIAEGIMPPTPEYLEAIVQGYRDFHLEEHEHLIDKALHEAWGNKSVTPILRERHVRKGKPKLARIEARVS